MGLSKAQKARKYGTGSQAPSRAAASASGGPAMNAPSVRDLPPGALAATPTRSSSAGILVGVALAVGALLWLYLHVLVLPGFATTAAGGLTAPELRPGGFSPADMQHFAAALGSDGPGEYAGIHATTGLFAPLLLALGMVLFIGLNTTGRLRTWLYWCVPLAYAVVFVTGSHALDAAVAAPGDPAAVGLASALVVTRWVLFAALVVIAIIVVVGIFRRKFSDFAEGKLPGQRASQR